MKKAFVSVTNDLSTDQRVDRTCITLKKMGYEVTLVGRKLHDSLAVERDYKTKRFKLFFNKGAFFYADYNLSLFFYLLFKKVDLLFSNDLDTLLPNYLIYKLKKTKIIYDSHEYFTGVPELEGRWVKKVWLKIEKSIFPKLENIITVNDSIAKLYFDEYGKELSVIRNIPKIQEAIKFKSREELGLPSDKKIILLQGAGINIDRGAEEAVEAMQYIENAVLLIIGCGDVIEILKKMVVKLEIQSKVVILPKQPFNELRIFTRIADLGLTLDKDTNINYRYSLPNKLFDYIHSGVPVLGSKLVEVEKIIREFDIGDIIPNHNPKEIAEKINYIFADNELLKKWKRNTNEAAKALNWKQEEKKLIEVINKSRGEEAKELNMEIGNEKHIHHISFDIPIPANYGGAIDVFYKLKAFKNAGIKIHLHCFQYGRKQESELDELCETVNYYPRQINKAKLFSRWPYIVVTRASEELLDNLLKDNYPILFEGLHSCYHLENEKLRKRLKIVRTHNIEHDYYTNLGKVEKNIFKRYYFQNEASKLERYESVLQYANGIAAISQNDKIHFEEFYSNVECVSAFHSNDEVNIKPGLGEYALYHGSLEVGENNSAALFLINEVFNDIEIPLYIAGSKPSKELIESVKQFPNVKLITKVTSEEIYELIKNAQINILPTFQATGIKLKLLAALHMGRHCIVNTPMVYQTGLEDICIIKDDVNEMKEEVKKLFSTEFGTAEIEIRKKVLLENGFSNSYNINKLIDMLFG
ncbi:MAG: glycosyltransferase [Saprospiraceae bacterium]|nr:glycosyltransferase [Saprospiraceae bacterium]